MAGAARGVGDPVTPAELADLRARFTAALYTDIARRRRRRRVRVETVGELDLVPRGMGRVER